MTTRKKAAPKPPALRGRPETYDPDWHPRKAEELSRLGATMEQIASVFDVHVRTVWQWSNQHPEFNQSVKMGAGPADDAVERSLYQRAMGYETRETENLYEMTEVQDPVSGEVRVFRKLVGVKEKVKSVAPDTTAQIFWLKNRRPAEWRESYEHIVNDPDEVSSEQLAKQLMFTFRQFAEEGGDPAKLLSAKTARKKPTKGKPNAKRIKSDNSQ